MATPRETHQGAIAAWNDHDLEKLSNLYGADVVLVNPDAGELNGREQAIERDRVFIEAFPDAKMEIGSSYETGNTSIIEWELRGTNTGPLPLPSGEILPATGKEVVLKGVDVVTVEGEELARVRTYYDQVELLTQLELMP